MSIEDNLKVIGLIDVYGSLLTSKQFDMISNYYFDNLTLAEIGDNYGISRQAVRDSISQSIKSLEAYEEKLGIISKEEYIIGKLNALSDKYSIDELSQDLSEIIEELRG